MLHTYQMTTNPRLCFANLGLLMASILSNYLCVTQGLSIVPNFSAKPMLTPVPSHELLKKRCNPGDHKISFGRSTEGRDQSNVVGSSCINFDTAKASLVTTTILFILTTSFNAAAASTIPIEESNVSGECQSFCMYKCTTAKATKNGDLIQKCRRECGEEDEGSSTSLCRSDSPPQVTQTREPRLLNSKRIDQLYETWQDQFCPDEQSLCAHGQTRKVATMTNFLGTMN